MSLLALTTFTNIILEHQNNIMIIMVMNMQHKRTKIQKPRLCSTLFNQSEINIRFPRLIT